MIGWLASICTFDDRPKPKARVASMTTFFTWIAGGVWSTFEEKTGKLFRTTSSLLELGADFVLRLNVLLTTEP
jgi:hypothetical protein